MCRDSYRLGKRPQAPDYLQEYCRFVVEEARRRNRVVVYIGFSRGAWWGIDLLHGGCSFSKMLLLAPYFANTLSSTEKLTWAGETAHQAQRTGTRVLLVGSTADSACPWAVYGPAIVRMQEMAPQLVDTIIHTDLSHEQVREHYLVSGWNSPDAAGQATSFFLAHGGPR
jgi:predicted esterase